MSRVKLDSMDNKLLLKIDRSKLDEELIHQPYNFGVAAEAYARAVSERDAAKTELDQLTAELSLAYRNSAENEGKKVTEMTIQTLVSSDPDHKKAVFKLLRLREHTEILAGEKEAWNQRAFVLRDLVALYNSGYWSNVGVTVSANAGNEAMRRQISRVRQSKD